MGGEGLSRRTFLRRSVAAAAFTIVPRHVLGGQGHVAPSEKLTHAVIGVGGMGRGHVGYALRDKKAVLLAVCDVDSKHVDLALKMAESAGHPCKGYKDFRAVLDRGDIPHRRTGTP
jgi:hypothetical protein